MGIRVATFVCILLSCNPLVFGQEKIPSPNEIPGLEALMKETQRSVSNEGHVGLIWWIPTEFWEQAAEKHGSSIEQARKTFGTLRQYTVIGVAIGKLGIGNVNWYNEQIVRSSITLKDSDGTVYNPLTELSGDAKGLVSIFRVVFANMLGAMGQNFQILFFPAATAQGKRFADPRQEGSFTVAFSYPQEKVESLYEWRLPLTSLSPPKYCPVGKERVQADWKYCPWHGNKLDGAQGVPNEGPRTSSHPEEKKVP